jgi:hypothetical protein
MKPLSFCFSFFCRSLRTMKLAEASRPLGTPQSTSRRPGAAGSPTQGASRTP